MKSIKFKGKITLLLTLAMYPTLMLCLGHGNTETMQSGNNISNNNPSDVKQLESPEIIKKSDKETFQTGNMRMPNSQEYDQASSGFASSNGAYINNGIYNSQIRTVTVNPRLVPINSQQAYQNMNMQNYNLQTNQYLINSNNGPVGLLDNNYSNKPRVMLSQVCPCSAYYKCSPCGSLSYKPPINCGCAPKLNCPKCPPLSVIHEIASRKAIQDQKLASELRNISTSMSEIFKSISKYAGDVLKYETEAKENALKMEEAGLKAHLAKQQMERTSDQARLIAKRTLSKCNDCIPSGIDQQGLYNQFINDKVFPEEVDSIGEYMKDTFSTNGYADSRSDFNTTDMIEKENPLGSQVRIQEASRRKMNMRSSKMIVLEKPSSRNQQQGIQQGIVQEQEKNIPNQGQIQDQQQQIQEQVPQQPQQNEQIQQQSNN